MIFQILYLSALGIIEFTFGNSEGGRKYRSLGRVNYSENSFRCPSEGFHPDARDCRTFYRCVDWTSNDYFRDYTEPQLTAFRFECGEGTVFDPDFNVCNHPRDTKRSECGGRQSGQGEYPTQGQSEKGEYPDYEKNKYPNHGGYKDQSEYQEKVPNETENLTMPTKEEGIKPVPLSPTDSCPSPGFHPVKGNCQKFVRCVDNGNGGYMKYEFSCGPGTVWDPVKTVCNYPSKVPECGEAEESKYPEQQPGGPFGQGEYPGQEQNEFSGQGGQGGYPGQVGQGGQGGYPSQGGTPGQGGQSGYPEQSGQGGFPGQVGQGGYPGQSGQGGQEGQGGYPGQGEQSGQAGTPEGTTPGGKFTGECNASGFYGVPENCKKFVRCVDNGNGGFSKYEFECAEGTGWDVRLNTCNHAYMIKDCQHLTQPSSGQEGTSQQGGYPSQGGMPGQGGYPSQGGTPEQGGYPSQGGMPGQGGYPSQGGMPGQGGYPSQGGMPGQGGYPSQGGMPGQGGYPSQGGMPGQGGYPSQGGMPGQGGYPSQGGMPGQGGYPSQGGMPGQGGYPSQGGMPEQGGYPSQGGMPGQGGYPSQGGMPGQGGYPSQGGTPEQGGYPSQGGMPGQGGYPSQGGMPGQGGYPSQGGMPGQGGYPSQGGMPGQGGYPSQGGMPGQGGYPEKKPDNSESKNPPPSDQCQAEGFFPVQNNCKAFYRCVNNGKGGYLRFDFNCGEGTAWDQDIQTCNYPWAIARGMTNCEMTSTNETWSQTTSSASFSTLTQSTSNSSSTSSQNQTNTLSTSSQTGSSQFQTQTTTTTGSQTQTQGSQATANQTFSQSTNEFSSNRPTDQGFTKPMTSQPKPTTESPKPDEASRPPPGSSPCDKNEFSGQIKCEKDGFYPDPKDCSKFYRCADWGNKKFSVYYFECGKGTIWDPALETCNHEKSVYPPRDCRDSSNVVTQKPSKDQSTPLPMTSEPNNASTTSEPTSNISTSESNTLANNETATNQPATEPLSTTSDSDSSTPLTTIDSQMTTGMPPSQTSTSDTTEKTYPSTDQTESTTSSAEMGTKLTESTSSEPITSTSSTDATESTSKLPVASTESAISPTEETTDGSTISQTESTTSNPEVTEATESTESTTSTGTMTTEASSGENPDCPQLNEDQSAFVCPTGFKRHPKDCNLFYQCTTSKDTGDINVMILSCKNDTIYDERKIQCLPPDEADPCKNNGLRKRVYRNAEEEFSSVVYVSPYKRLCPEEGSFAYEGDCTRFYKCKKDKRGKIQGYLYQCPKNFYFNDITGRCEKSTELPQCTRFIPEITVKRIKWMNFKVPVEYSNLTYR